MKLDFKEVLIRSNENIVTFAAIIIKVIIITRIRSIRWLENKIIIRGCVSANIGVNRAKLKELGMI